MGQRFSSKSSGKPVELGQSQLIESLSNATLVGVLHYVNGTETIDEVASIIAENWSFSGKIVDKEKIFVICTFAAQGQGKTELCTQLAKNSSLLKPEGVSVMVAIPISFNQSTTIDINGVDKDLERALVWRILFAFGNDEQQIHDYSGGLRTLLKEIRQANCPKDAKLSSVGIFLMVDEVLKVQLESDDYFRRLLDMLCNLQQHDLRLSLPTFVLITSLEVLPVSKEVVTRSGRRLRGISLPIFTDADLEAVSMLLYDHFLTVLSINRTPIEVKKLEAFQNLRILIRVAVSVSGRHFRTLEDAMRAVYKRVVSVSAHNLALKSKIPAELFRPATGKQEQQTVDLFSGKGTGVSFTLKEVFDVVVNQILLADPSRAMYEQARDLFLDLINFPALEVEEKDLYPLENAKIVFVKFRAPGLTTIVPRVSLPFLFMYPKWQLSWQLQPSSSSSVGQEQLRQNILCGRYRRLMEPTRLTHHTEILLYNIGQALSGPFEKLSRDFEDVVPFAELLTTAAKERLGIQSVSSDEVLRGMAFIPRAEETLVVSPFVLKKAITISVSPSSCNIKNHPNPNAEAVRALVRLALSSECNAVYVTQPKDLNTQCVEYVSRLFSVGERQVMCFCSMKLRENSDPLKISEDMHKFVQSEVLSQCGVEDKDYFVVLYCCVRVTEDIKQKLPRGTLIVGFECLKDLLYPFGLSPLILEAEYKCAANARKSSKNSSGAVV
jgi:hypothetical protein